MNAVEFQGVSKSYAIYDAPGDRLKELITLNRLKRHRDFWALHEHANVSSKEDAVLFSYNDFPVLQAMDLLREETLETNGGHQEILS